MDSTDDRLPSRKSETAPTSDSGEARSSEIRLETGFGRLSAKGPELIPIATLVAMLVWSIASAGEGRSQDLVLLGATGVVLYLIAVLSRLRS